MKKLFMGVIFALVCCVAITFTNTVNADSTTVDKTRYASVADNTQADSLVDPTDVGKLRPEIVVANDGKDITVTYDAAKLKIVEEAVDIKRPKDYAWIGLKMTAPDNAKYCKVQNDDEEKSVSGTFDEYFGISEANLKASIENESKAVTYNYVITWFKDKPSEHSEDPNNTIGTQTIKVIVKSQGVVLQDSLSGTDKTLWNKDVYDEEVKKVEEAKKAAQQNTTKKEDKKDSTPKTGVVDYSIYVAIATAVVALGGVYTLKKLVK